jgi:hypothetical protein
MKPFAIIDLDNCVFDDYWRLELIDLSKPIVNDRYIAYHNECHRDNPGQVQLMYVRHLAKSYDLLIFTSRPEFVREKTKASLSKWGIPYYALYMRADDDHNPSVEVKRNFLRKATSDALAGTSLDRIEMAIDDRQDILDMYREEGVPRVERIFICDHAIPLERIVNATA